MKDWPSLQYLFLYRNLSCFVRRRLTKVIFDKAKGAEEEKREIERGGSHERYFTFEAFVPRAMAQHVKGGGS